VGLGGVFKTWFGLRNRPPQNIQNRIQSVEEARIDDNRVVYAIGDIHGMSGLLDNLLHKIIDDRETIDAKAELIFLGDMVDRGPNSQEVIDTIYKMKHGSQNLFVVHVLQGNHERMMIDFIANPEKTGAMWLRHGGDATLQSYGVHSPQQPTEKHLRYLRNEFVDRLLPEHSLWLGQLDSKFTIGDYFFCHASINARKALSEQKDEDLLWSRRFPDDEDGPQEKIIVHGHLPVTSPLIAKYHINVDTGAFATGCLTAVKLIGQQRSFLSTAKLTHSQKSKD
jgi:serine/threonine protein phosphatase 1